MSSTTFLRIAKVCALLPLLSGCSILALWMMTGWDWLQLAGFLVLFGGAFLFFVGLMALFLYELELPAQQRNRLLSWCPTTKWILVLLLNWPVALGCIIAAETEQGRNGFEVRNESADTIDEVLIYGEGSVDCYETLGPIPGGGVAEQSFWLGGEGSVSYRVRVAGVERVGTLIGYTCTGMSGEEVVMTIHRDLTVTVEPQW